MQHTVGTQSSSMERMGRWLCLLGASLGAVGLMGWFSGFLPLTTLIPGQPVMAPNTALALLLLGGAAALRERPNVRQLWRMLSVLAVLAVLGGSIATIAEYAFAVDLGIDRLLLPDGVHRPSPPASLALALLALALLLIDFRVTARARPSEWLSAAGGVIALSAL